MARIKVSVRIDAPPARVWAIVRDIGSHTVWMKDAERITFTSRRRTGVGTTFDCDTRVGPLRTVDKMEITEWRPLRSVGVRHTGVVHGEGRFTIRRHGGRRATFSWSERLRFPWWLGGPVGAAVAKPVLRAIWRRNLQNLKRLVEGTSAGRDDGGRRRRGGSTRAMQPPPSEGTGPTL